MRRLTGVILGAILILALASTAQAQIALGIRGGYNNSTVSVTEDGTSVSDQYSSRAGFFAGGELAFGFSTMWGLQVGGQYSQKGASISEGSNTITLAADYIDVPVLLVVSIPTGGSITPRLFAGGVASFEISCKFKMDSESQDCTAGDLGARTKQYFSALFGAGIGFAAGPGSLVLDADYQLGLTNISGEDDIVETVKMNVIQVSLGYQFPLGG